MGKEQNIESKEKALHIADVRERLITALDKVCEKRGNRFGEDIYIGHMGGYDYELSQIDTDELIDALIEEYENALQRVVVPEGMLPKSYCPVCKQDPCERLGWSQPLEDEDDY